MPSPRCRRAGSRASFGAALAAALLFWSMLLFGGPLHGHDWSSHHYHYFDWVRIALSEHGTLPLYMADAWVTPNFLANAEAPTLGPLAWLLLLLPTGAYVKLLIVVFTAAGLAGMYLLLRDLEVSPALAVLAAAVFACNGFFTSHLGVGHHWAMGAYLLPALLWLYRRAALGSDGALLAAALLNAFTILGGQHQPFIWQNLLALGLRRALGPARARWLPALALGARAARHGGACRREAPAALGRVRRLRADGAHPGAAAGCAARRADGRRPGPGAGRSAHRLRARRGLVGVRLLRGAGCAGVSGGGLPGGAGQLAHAGDRRLLPGAERRARLGLWPLLEDLPVWRSQRAPSRFLFLALFAFLVVAAPGGERLRARAQAQRRRALAVFVWGLALLVSADLWVESRAWQRAATGPAIATADHRPRPLVVQAPGARAELREFAPNRLRLRGGGAPRGAGRAARPLRQAGGPESRVAGWKSGGRCLEAPRAGGLGSRSRCRRASTRWCCAIGRPGCAPGRR